MGFFSSKKGSIISDYFCPEHDIGAIRKGDMTDIALYDDHLALSNLTVKTPITLQYSQITDVFYGYREQLIEKEKSIIGRAVVGGLLFGGVGAVVGAVSGTGKKEVKQIDPYLIISYTAKDGTDQFLEFKDTRRHKGEKLADKLMELCSISHRPNDPITSL